MVTPGKLSITQCLGLLKYYEILKINQDDEFVGMNDGG